ncbi:MAG: thermonuclease family protein [Litorimonas sp.]
MDADQNSLMPTRRRAILGIGVLGLIYPALARANEYTPLTRGEVEPVSRIIDGDSFVLSSGLSVKLASIEAPQSALRPQNRAAWPFAKEATAALSGFISGRDVQLFYGGQRRDRHRRAIAQIYTLTPDGAPDLWVQEEMIRLGLARVYTWDNESVDSARLYIAEGQARAAGRGIWNDEFYAVRSPEPNSLAQYVDSTQIVEGIILSAADVRGRIYLNFGTDYKTDFTITIARKNVKKFTKANIDLLGLEGARVRVRGWIELINGPSIWADHPARLEVLDIDLSHPINEH